MRRGAAAIILCLLLALSGVVLSCAPPVASSSATSSHAATIATPSTPSDGTIIPAPSPSTTPATSVQIEPATINQVRIDFLQTQPVQVSVYIKIGLRDTCTTFHDITTGQSGNTITIRVTDQHVTGAVCGQIYTFVEKNMNLGSSFVSGQMYTVQVNDQTTTFTMP